MPFRSPTPLETNRLILRPPANADLPDLLKANGDDEVTRFLPYDTWRALEDAEAWLKKTEARHACGEVQQYVLALKDSGKVIGACIVFAHDEKNACAEIGYVLGRDFWGNGLMKEAMTGLIDRCFNDLGLRRLEAFANPENVRSTRILDRLRFQAEGLLRSRWQTKDGYFADAAIYGILKEDWGQSERQRTLD